jgi:hypothetical protein
MDMFETVARCWLLVAGYGLRPHVTASNQQPETSNGSLAMFYDVLAALLELFLFPLVPLLHRPEEAADAGIDFRFFGTFAGHSKLSFA